MTKERFVNIRLVRPNPWNPNRMTDEQFAATLNSLRVHGFTNPIIVRAADKISQVQIEKILNRLGNRREDLLVSRDDMGTAKYEIIDGEHRWVVAQHLIKKINSGQIEVVDNDDVKGLALNQMTRRALETLLNNKGEAMVPIYTLGKVPDVEAQRLTIVLNETRGEPDVAALSSVVKTIAEAVGPDSIAATLPPEVIGDINLGLEQFDWDSYVKDLDEAVETDKQTVLPFSMDHEAYEVFLQAANAVAERNGWTFTESDEGLKRAVMELVDSFLAVEQ